MDELYVLIDRELRHLTPEQHKEISERQKETNKRHHIYEPRDGQLYGVGPTEGDIVVTREETVGGPGHWPGINIGRHREWTKGSGKECPGT